MANISGTASTEIDAPIDAVWTVVQDVGQWAQWQSTLGQVTPTAQDADGRASGCEVDIDAKITKISLALECAYAQPSQMTFTRTSGNLSSLDGSGASTTSAATARSRPTRSRSIPAGCSGSC
jgi:polyketide cyclase/dehydrase/lipid transport protein